MRDRLRHLSVHRRSAYLLVLAVWVIGLQLWLIVALLPFGSINLLALASLGLVGIVALLGLSTTNCYRLQKILNSRLVDSEANSRLLDELQTQRDTLARSMAERAQSDVRLRLLESAVVHARDAIIILEAEPTGEFGRSVLYVNQAFTEMTGYTAREVIGRSLHFLRGPQSDSHTLELLRQALDTNSTLHTELLNYRKDGTPVWVELNLVPVLDTQNQNSIAHWVMIQRDATQRKQAEYALKQSEERLRAIYHNTNTGVAVARPNGQLLEVNPAFCRMLGYEAPELLTLTVHELTHPEDRPYQNELFQAVQTNLMDMYNVQKRYIHKRGHVVWVDLHCHVVHNLAGEPTSVIGVVMDITERKRAQEALRQSEERYRLLFEANPQPMWVLDRKSLRFQAVNSAAIIKYGYSVEEFLDLSLLDLTDPSERDQLRMLCSDDGPVTVHDRPIWTQQTRFGNSIHVEIAANDLPAMSGVTTSTLMLVTDVTDKHRLEEQLRQSQKMEAIGQLAGGIAHDFNNLLTGIVGNLALIDLPSQDPNRQLVNTAEKAASRAAELTRKLLGFARRNQLLLAPVSVNDFITEVIGLLQRTFDPRIEIVSQVEVQEPIMADATLINQALLNLCINSRDAMPQGGCLTLRAEYVDVQLDQLKLHPEARSGRYVRISVQDTGSGMPPEVKSRIFEPFFTTKPVGQGTGLGLPMVHGILKQHQGWVNCESVPGQGTCFELYLPRVTSRTSEGSTVIRRTHTQRDIPLDTITPRPLRRSLHEPRSVQTTRTILLVDDEEMIREIARVTLETEGFVVQQAGDGVEAVELFREHHASIDLVLLDLTMPRLSGRDAFGQMLAIDPQARIMFASGYSTDDLSDVNGAIGLLPKPYRPQELLQAVNNALNLSSETVPTAV